LKEIYTLGMLLPISSLKGVTLGAKLCQLLLHFTLVKRDWRVNCLFITVPALLLISLHVKKVGGILGGLLKV